MTLSSHRCVYVLSGMYLQIKIGTNSITWLHLWCGRQHLLYRYLMQNHWFCKISFVCVCWLMCWVHTGFQCQQRRFVNELIPRKKYETYSGAPQGRSEICRLVTRSDLISEYTELKVCKRVFSGNDIGSFLRVPLVVSCPQSLTNPLIASSDDGFHGFFFQKNAHHGFQVS